MYVGTKIIMSILTVYIRKGYLNGDLIEVHRT